jgi:methanethiol S-methyltransferase
MELLLLALGWIFYFIIHSVLAMHQVKEFVQSLGISPQRYRLFYNLISLITLGPILILSSGIQEGYVFESYKILKYSGLILAGYGVVLARMAFKSYDTMAFLGLGSLSGEEEFKTDGLLKYVRHPVYSASILILTGYFLFDPKWSTLISVSMLILYFIVGSRFEERKLIRQFGEKYIDYKRKTPMLIPRFRRKP